MKNIFVLSLLVLFIGCKSDKKVDQKSTEETAIAKKYTLTPFKESAFFGDAEIKDMTFQDGEFVFDLAESRYKLGEQSPDKNSKMCANSDKGQHIHLIVNNSPYAAKYESTFDYNLPNGEHHLLAFLSRSYHESIKTDKAYYLKKILVEDNSIKAAVTLEDPLLFYSRPKGVYLGKDTEKVMLDFYVSNCELGTDYKVKANINGEEHVLDKWQPYYIEGLPMGENTIELKLIDASGKLVETPLNPVARHFTLKADPAEEM